MHRSVPTLAIAIVIALACVVQGGDTSVTLALRARGGMCVPYTPPDAPGPNSVVAPSDESLCVGEGEPVCQGEQLTGKSLPLYDACM